MPLLKVEKCDQSVIKIYSNENLRAAILDINCLSVYLFSGNRRIIATERMNAKTLSAAMNLCKVWVLDGIYNESDFAV